MPFFDNLTKKVGDAAKTAAKKSSELYETTRLNMAINSEEDKIKGICTEIGKIIYAKYKIGEISDGEILNQCQQIDSIQLNIESIKEKINQLKTESENVVYQSSPTPEPQNQANFSAPQGKFCPSCGAQVQADTKFCPSCGNKF